MAASDYYSALIAIWATLPAGDTTARKLAVINALTVSAPQPAIFSSTQIVNAIAPADLATLTALQVAVVTLMLTGGTVNGSAGTTTRLALQTIFAGKTTTLTNLGALVAPFDGATVPWWQASVANGGGGLTSPITQADLTAAGGLS